VVSRGSVASQCCGKFTDRPDGPEATLRDVLARTLAALSALAAAFALAAAPHAARSSAAPYVAPAGSGILFLLSGHGWGHGVGMGQWGAQGYAQQGYTSDQILAAYYPGTTLGQSTANSIRVLLADGKSSLAISSGQPMAVEDGDGINHTLGAGMTTLTPALQLAVDGGPSQALTPPLTFSPAAGSKLKLGRTYRGQIVVDVVNGKLRAINVLPLEQYLYGVVPAEEPSSWLPAALDAQAVAARSYALASRRAAAPFDVYADGRSQAYLGVSAEKPTATQAVNETSGEVLFFGSHVADTLFSSSTGGLTQSAADAFGSAGKPYLVSVKDPFDGISPYHDWGPVAVTAKTLGQALHVTGRIVDATVTRNASKRVRTIKVTALARGKQSTTGVAGGFTASALSLRSTWFSVGVLSLQPPSPNPPVASGARVLLSGVVRAVSGVVVQQRSAGKPWTQFKRIAPAAKGGAFRLVVRPSATTDYRLATSRDAAAYVRIRVTPTG
jgi:stage II sporulation protein D